VARVVAALAVGGLILDNRCVLHPRVSSAFAAPDWCWRRNDTRGAMCARPIRSSPRWKMRSTPSVKDAVRSNVRLRSYA
jgi:hypothetical protein